MNVTVRPILNQNGVEIGVVLTANVNYIPTPAQKNILDQQLRDYVHNIHYRGIPLSVFNHNETDTGGIVALKDINNLQQMQVVI